MFVLIKFEVSWLVNIEGFGPADFCFLINIYCYIISFIRNFFIYCKQLMTVIGLNSLLIIRKTYSRDIYLIKYIAEMLMFLESN